jgi:flagellar operon protein
MADTYVNGVRVPFLPARGVDGFKDRTTVQQSDGPSFDSVFQEELRGLTFSRHAQERLQARKIQLNESDLANLQGAVNRAEEKGAKDSLVLMRDMAFIVSVRNRTVVTAMDSEHLKENVFTNIDSAVIV